MPERNKRFSLMASVNALGNRRGEVMIYSAISTYAWGDDDPTVTSNKFDKQLKELGDVDEITVRINSPGGAVSEAIAIRTTLMKHPAKKIVDIEGCCDSAATLIACLPGAKVRMAKGGEYMIHRCSWIAWGHADAMLSAYNSMTTTDKEMAGIYSERTGKSVEDCLELMTAETWYGSEDALEAGFVDEIITGAEGDDEPIAACAVDEETMKLMRSCYAHAPEHAIKAAQAPAAAPGNNVSNGNTAVAAEHPSENNLEGVNTMDELRNATAEQLAQENPELVASIGSAAVEAERARIREIDDLTPEGEEYAQMCAAAKADGTSAADYLKKVAAKSKELKEAQKQKGAAYMANRQQETAGANNVGGGDAGDNDGDDAKADRAAKEVADLAKGMTGSAVEMF